MSAAQSTDPAVSRKKFNREINEFRSQNEEYRRRGWLLAHAKYPHALVILVSPKTNPVTVLTGVLFDYTNYDAMPPSVQLVHPTTGEPYKSSQLPTKLPRLLPAPDMPGAPEEILQVQALQAQGLQVQPFQAQTLMQDYGPDDIPFLCIAGVREYHEHPAHSGDHWELHRSSGAGRLVRLVEIISKYGLETVTGLNVQMIPNIRFNFLDVPPE